MSADLRMTTFGPFIGARSGHILPEAHADERLIEL
jgi:hypothetical protein